MISITRSEHGFNGGMRERAIYSEEKMEETHKRLKVCIFRFLSLRAIFDFGSEGFKGFSRGQ